MSHQVETLDSCLPPGRRYIRRYRIYSYM